MPLILPTWSVEEDIFRGFWINQSLGSVRGATLTLDRQAGGIVIAFLALLIAATARSFWKITRYLFHSFGSMRGGQDGIYHQKQAILRNQALARDAVLDLCRLGFVWKDRAAEVPKRTIPIILMALLISMASIAAGLLSSRLLTNSNNEVLISGRNCGLLNNDQDLLPSTFESIMLYQSQKCTDAFTYAAQCYREDGIKSEACNTFTSQTLPFTSDRNASCPFSKDICTSDYDNILLDAGLVDSVQHLGVNKGPRFVFRHQSHCAPLKTEGYTETFISLYSSRPRQIYRYGSRYDRDTHSNKPYVLDIELKDQGSSIDGVTTGDYKVIPLLVTDSDSNIELIPELKQSNASVSLLFLDSSEVVYLNRTTDPWFTATIRSQNSSFLSPASGNLPFVPDKPLTVLGCVTRRSYCYPNAPPGTECVDGFATASGRDIRQTLERAWPNTQDRSAMLAWIAALSNSGAGNLDAFYAIPSSPTLLSRSTILGNMQTAIIPADRWKDEREHLYKASLAALQSMAVEHARGFTLRMNTFCVEKDTCRRICHSQKVISSSHYSFSAWSLGLIIILCGILQLASIFLEEILAILLRAPRFRNQKLVYSLAEWQAGSTLQLQRLAHENLGIGTWTRTDEAIPVTEPGDTLAMLDISSTKHARMIAPTEELSIIKRTGGLPGNVKPSSQYLRLPSTDHD